MKIEDNVDIVIKPELLGKEDPRGIAPVEREREIVSDRRRAEGLRRELLIKRPLDRWDFRGKLERYGNRLSERTSGAAVWPLDSPMVESPWRGRPTIGRNRRRRAYGHV